MTSEHSESYGTFMRYPTPRFRKHHQREGTKNVRAGQSEGTLWNALFRTWHGCCIQELTAGVMTCVKPVQDLVSHNPSIVKKRVNTAPPQLRSCWHLRGYFFFYGYIDTGRLPIVFVKVSSALLKHLAINMGEEKIYFSLQPSGHTSLSWEVRAGT